MSAERLAQRHLAVSRLTVPLLIGLVAAVVSVSAVLAYEAYRARHSMRVTAERALAQYATMAGWELDAAVRARLDRALSDLFAPVLAGVATSPYDQSPEPTLLVPRASALGIACGAGRASVLRLDLESGRITAAGAPIDAATTRVMQDGIQQQLRSTSAAETRFLISLAGTPLGGNAAVGVRSARFGAPIAAYAVPDCRAALLQASVGAALRGDPLLPAAVRGGLPNDSLLSVEVRDAAGAPLFRSSDLAPRTSLPEYTTVQPLRAFPQLTAQIALRPAARSVLLVSPPERSRLPMLLGLLALCVVLALVALIQLRREHELARLRADFTSSVSHELRTPLAQILLFGETLNLGRARSEDERALAATSIVREARRLMHMVENVLHFSRRRDAPDVRLEPIDLEPYLAEVVASFAPLATAAEMHVQTSVAGATVRADPAMLRQVVLNLLDNAVKYGRAGQTIIVGAEQSEGEGPATNGAAATPVVRLTVTDEGPGIAPSDRERVWSPYVRLRNNGARRAGSGIGLAVVRELVEAMNGRAWVESAHADGRGARFVVQLPSP
ncbi:MAG: sensor histidine kinase [Gemmatimonadaceae bacterium]